MCKKVNKVHLILERCGEGNIHKGTSSWDHSIYMNLKGRLSFIKRSLETGSRACGLVVCFMKVFRKRKSWSRIYREGSVRWIRSRICGEDSGCMWCRRVWNGKRRWGGDDKQHYESSISLILCWEREFTLLLIENICLYIDEQY